jgi:heterodisulfide reductase subunit A-like polyferredoxin
MPDLPLSKRKGNYEETNLGISEEQAKRESGRCLNCAICCECMECEQVCELKAVNHKDTAKKLSIEADSIINFVSSDRDLPEINKPGVYNIAEIRDGGMPGDLSLASAVALSAAIELKQKDAEKKEKQPAVSGRPISSRIGLQSPWTGKRTGVFLCRCGDSISSVIDFKKVSQAIVELPDVVGVWELAQSCTVEGSEAIRDRVAKEKIEHVVLAACRCCNLEQICFSCTDRRVMCQNNLSVELPTGVNMEFANIREQCAWVHKDDPEGATGKAIELITTGVARAQKLIPAIYEPRRVSNSVLIIGTGIAGLAAAQKLAAQGYPVTVISELNGYKSNEQTATYRGRAS